MPSQRQIHVGRVPIGGGAPVAVQTMTKTETADLQATMDQIARVAEAGADIVRVAVPRDKDVEALKTIVAQSPIPIIADIHFNHTLAIVAFAGLLIRRRRRLVGRGSAADAPTQVIEPDRRAAGGADGGGDSGPAP